MEIQPPKIKLNKIYSAKEDFEPLFRKRDKFKIIELIEDTKHFLPIVAMSLKNGDIFGFEENELEEIRNGN
jgi:hypothetical protein